MDQDNLNQQPAGAEPPKSNVQPSQEPPRSMPSSSDPSAPITPTPPEKPAGGNKKLIIIIGVVVALLVLGGVIVFATRGDKAEDATTTQTSSDTPDSSKTPDNSSATSSTTPQSGEVSIDIKDFAFSPEKITVKKGTKVTWTNEDTVAHTVTSDEDSPQKGLDSGNLAKGKTYSFTFEQVGEFSYHCAPHPNMIGSVEVVE